jgi:uncharacterized protein YfaQ (DUF2300 family)
MAYDSSVDGTVLFGGVGTCGVLADTWSWSRWSGSWNHLFLPTGPAARANAAAGYDSTGHALFLGGSGSSGNVLLDTWRYGVGP